MALKHTTASTTASLRVREPDVTDIHDDLWLAITALQCEVGGYLTHEAAANATHEMTRGAEEISTLRTRIAELEAALEEVVDFFEPTSPLYQTATKALEQ